MYCYDCKRRDCKSVYIPVPTNTWKPTVCEDCAKERERKWGHTWKKGTGKWSKTGYNVLVKGHQSGIQQ